MTTPSDERTLTTIARTIARGLGLDPDEMVTPDPDSPAQFEPFPRWHHYRDDAVSVLAALREQGWKSPTEIRAALDTPAARSCLRYPSSGVPRPEDNWTDEKARELLRVLVGDEQAEEAG